MLLMWNIFSLSLIISCLLLILNFFFQSKKICDREKFSPFECGFDPFSSPRLPFSIHFFLISMVFLIFDIEIILILPLIILFFKMNLISWLSITLLFIIMLIYSLYMEWMDGALNWMP